STIGRRRSFLEENGRPRSACSTSNYLPIYSLSTHIAFPPDFTHPSTRDFPGLPSGTSDTRPGGGIGPGREPGPVAAGTSRRWVTRHRVRIAGVAAPAGCAGDQAGFSRKEGFIMKKNTVGKKDAGGSGKATKAGGGLPS